MAKTIKVSYTKACQNAFEKAIEKATIDFIKVLIKNKVDFKETTLEEALELINFQTNECKKSKSISKKKKTGKYQRPRGRARTGKRWSYSKGVWLDISEHGTESADEDIIENNDSKGKSNINEESKEETNNTSKKKPKKKRIVRKKKKKEEKIKINNDSSDDESSSNESDNDFSNLMLNNNSSNSNNSDSDSDSDSDNSDGDIHFSDGEF